MTEFVVHSIAGSPFGRSVLIALEEKRIPYRLDPIAPGTLKSPEHLARHPFGRIPTIEHGDFQLYETQAILRYIDRVMPEPALTPRDARSAARMDMIMNVNDWYLFTGCVDVIGFQRIVGPRLMGLATDEVAIQAALPHSQKVFEELSRQLGAGPFFTGASLSLADVMIAPQLDFIASLPEWGELSAPHENLRDWMQRLNQRPSMQATTWERVAAMARAA